MNERERAELRNYVARVRAGLINVRCAYCKGAILVSEGKHTTRPRVYCSHTCQRRAQRARSAGR